MMGSEKKSTNFIKEIPFFYFLVAIILIEAVILSFLVYSPIDNVQCVWSKLEPYFFQTQLLGVLIGGVLTLASSYFLFSLKNLHEKKNIARGFLSELNIYSDWVTDFLERFTRTAYTPANIEFMPELNRPIFDDESLYYELRKEIFQFDNSLVEQLLFFYSLLKAAEEDRRILLYLWKSGDIVKNSGRIIELNTHMVETIQKANRLIPEIHASLQTVINRTI